MHTLRREEADLKRSANVVPAETPGALPQSRSAGELGRHVHCSNSDICRKRDNLVGLAEEYMSHRQVRERSFTGW